MKEIDITIFSHNIWGNICETETVSNRNACVATLIDAHDADIIAFQECNPRTSRSGDVDIAKLIAPEYVEVETCFGKNNCTPLFYRASRFSIVNSGFHP